MTLVGADGKTVEEKSIAAPSVGVYTTAIPAPPGEYTIMLNAGAVTRTSRALMSTEGEVVAEQE